MDLINKLRSIKRIESDVDALEATPINQEILNLNLEEPLPNLDTNYVGKVPRCVMALEHELTTKLLSLDEISGGSDVVRQRRKALVAYIERILSRVDAIKKAYNNSPNHPPKVEVMETEPTTTTTTDTATTTTDTATDSTTSDTTTSAEEMEIEGENKKKTHPHHHHPRRSLKRRRLARSNAAKQWDKRHKWLPIR